jgi:alpha/beta hydrolase fold
MKAGQGPAVLAVHDLGGTKGSFLPTLAALADRLRVIAMDLPGLGDSDKPVGASYDARFFARAVVDLLDALELERVHFVGSRHLLSSASATLSACLKGRTILSPGDSRPTGSASTPAPRSSRPQATRRADPPGVRPGGHCGAGREAVALGPLQAVAPTGRDLAQTGHWPGPCRDRGARSRPGGPAARLSRR